MLSGPVCRLSLRLPTQVGGRHTVCTVWPEAAHHSTPQQGFGADGHGPVSSKRSTFTVLNARGRAKRKA